jgi:hypothetical protein
MRLNGRYARLFRMQASAYTGEEFLPEAETENGVNGELINASSPLAGEVRTRARSERLREGDAK